MAEQKNHPSNVDGPMEFERMPGADPKEEATESIDLNFPSTLTVILWFPCLSNWVSNASKWENTTGTGPVLYILLIGFPLTAILTPFIYKSYNLNQ